MVENSLFIDQFFQVMRESLPRQSLNEETINFLKNISRHMNSVSFEINNSLRDEDGTITNPNEIKFLLEDLHGNIAKILADLNKETKKKNRERKNEHKSSVI